MEQVVEASIDAVKEKMYQMADAYFDYKPLNSPIIDSYNNFVDEELENILSNDIYVESEHNYIQVNFTHIVRLPPFKGALNRHRENDFTPDKLGLKREVHLSGDDAKENLRRFLREFSKPRNLSNFADDQLIERYAPREAWLLASEAKADNIVWNLTIYADVLITIKPKDRTKVGSKIDAAIPTENDNDDDEEGGS